MNYIFRIVALSLALITCWGCDKDDDSSQEFVSTGKDNYIVSFAITVDGISYNASITDDRILVKVPYDISVKTLRLTPIRQPSRTGMRSGSLS